MTERGDRERGFSRSFAEEFGVSEEELRRQGIDPVEYARERGALVRQREGPRSRGDVDSDALRERFRSWGLRFYAGAFVTLALLAIAYAGRHTPDVRIAAKAAAAVVGAIAVAMGALSYSYAVRYRRADRRAGMSWRRRP